MADALRLRRAEAGDVVELARVYAGSAQALGPLVYSPPQVAAWAAFGSDTPEFRDYVLGATTWVASGTDDGAGTVLGFAGVDDGGEVRSLYVRPGLMRQGLGTRLLAHALDDARQRGIARFEAWVTPFSRPVFERVGFAVVEVRTENYRGLPFERTRVRLG